MALITKKPDSRNSKMLAGLIAAGILLPLVKLNYIFISLAMIILPAKAFMRKRGELIKYSVAFLVTIISFAWSSIIKVSASAPVSQRPDGLKVDPAAQLSFVSHHPLSFIEACIRTAGANLDSYLQSGTGLIGWNYVPIPYVFILLLCLGLFIAAIYSKNELAGLHKRLILLAGFVVLGILGVFGALYIAFNPIGRSVIDGVQGRYFIPLAVPAILAVAAFIPIDLRIKNKVVPYLFSSISIVCLAVSVVYYYLMTY